MATASSRRKPPKQASESALVIERIYEPDMAREVAAILLLLEGPCVITPQSA